MENNMLKNIHVGGELIKSGSNLSKSELENLREQFITSYSTNKGWDKNSLTTEQLLEIVSNSDYKNPGLLRS
jgi:hypothetical protein